ncbi:NUDIX hydrolase [Streptomyces sp. NBC_01498]|uniref:NUDIX hydrolase n=1 Tax=Streptomyces sp. NBC_01498 TaxID=2975870 RepID=UPI002E7B8DA6|nr:NUDIX hydrolase [Streptomyces sp. NBC_01498]WTL25574.1 NUDIX hydrolase [Streptomyces sp. NBC_01498]
MGTSDALLLVRCEMQRHRSGDHAVLVVFVPDASGRAAWVLWRGQHTFDVEVMDPCPARNQSDACPLFADHTGAHPFRDADINRAALRRQAGMERVRLNKAEIISRYRAGESMNKLASAFGVYPMWLAARFDAWREPRRDMSAAQRLRRVSERPPVAPAPPDAPLATNGPAGSTPAPTREIPPMAHGDIHRAEQPRRRIGAVVLVRNNAGDVLLVKPTYKEGWQLPGGAAHQGEKVSDAAARELKEETGLNIDVTHFVALDHVPANEETGSPEGFNVVCNGGTLTAQDAANVAVPEDAAKELSSLRWVPLAELDSHALPYQERRIRQAVAAIEQGLQLPLLFVGEPAGD